MISKFEDAGYHAELFNDKPYIQFSGIKTPKIVFWKNRNNWRRASFNTLNCLIGCSIGDFGMILFLQAYYPEPPMYLQMVLAIIAGFLLPLPFNYYKLQKHGKACH
ncbi:MAG: DUF4396 domain-containing protein [Bacteroidales bacterium]|nr:DUF4396 domain-containing protein [Bacteroidales bacterium]